MNHNHNAYLPNLSEPVHQWMEDAACLNTFTELFFYHNKSTKNSKVADALRICQACPVIKRCLQFAFDSNDQYAVLGGTTPGQRREMRRQATI